MTDRVIILDRLARGETAAALMVDGRLEDLLVDPPEAEPGPVPGEIYWAKLDRPAGGGAFLRLTPDRTGWLREAKGLKPGQGVLVQISAHAEPGKACPVTTRLLFKRRLVIHSPDAPGINPSRRIRDAGERERLVAAAEAALAAIPEPVSGGFILRSAAAGADAAELAAEIAAALAEARAVREAATGPPPLRAPLSGPIGAAALALREWTDPLPDRFVIRRDGDALTSPTAMAAGSWPAGLGARLERAADPLETLEARAQIAALASPRVALAGGATMFVEPTRACVAVDINTGGDFSPAAGLKANIAALRELPRQLRLRGLGGQIVIDPAPMLRRDRGRLDSVLKAALKRDPVETNMVGWTPMGLIELQRKRERRPLGDMLSEDAR